MERTGADGEPSENPPEYLIPELESGVVREAAFIERDKPTALHSQEVMDEDDDFLSVGAEVWEYDIADGREQEFIDAMKNSQMVLDYEPLD
ncbi:MAG: hypothetical protein ACRD30_09815 [Bryobacteraceae bacterium]